MCDRDSDSAAALPALALRPPTRGRGTRFYAGSGMGTTVHRPTPDQRTSAEWLESLRADGARRDRAIADLHALLLRSARFELGRRRAALSHVRGEELEDLAMQAADDALMAVLSKLDHYRGASRFTTWAYKFALLEAGVRLRRRAWQGREVVLEAEAWPALGDERASAHDVLEQGELLAALKTAIDDGLTSHQRDVFVALALNQVPIDVLAERLNTTRGALYKTLHDARRKLRQELVGAGFDGLKTGATVPQEN
jgi:RNA polymerase sigma-70 factor (ECF subfamily)